MASRFSKAVIFGLTSLCWLFLALYHFIFPGLTGRPVIVVLAVIAVLLSFATAGITIHDSTDGRANLPAMISPKARSDLPMLVGIALILLAAAILVIGAILYSDHVLFPPPVLLVPAFLFGSVGFTLLILSRWPSRRKKE